MKQVNYVLGLLSQLNPKRVKRHKDSLGNPIDVVNIVKTPMSFRTIYPKGVATWDNISVASCKTWQKGMNVSRTHSRIVVAPLGTDIVNKNKLVLTNQM